PTEIYALSLHDALPILPAICQRCFRIRHYNEVSSVALDEGDFLRILNHIGERPALVVHIVDLFDFEGSLIGGLSRFAGSNPILRSEEHTSELQSRENLV